MSINLLQKIKSFFYLISGFSLILTGLILDIIFKNVELEIFNFIALQDIIKILGFGAFYLYIKSHWKRESIPLKRLIALWILSVILLGITILSLTLFSSDFEIKNLTLIPNTYSVIIAAHAVSVILGVGSIIILLLLMDIIFYKPRKNLKRNYRILIIVLLGAALSTINLSPYDSRLISTIFYGLVVLMILLNSFRIPWILFQKKKEKGMTILFSFLILGVFVGLKIFLSSNAALGKYLLYYSHPLFYFVDGTILFGIIYTGITFLSTIFHLPTAATFDKKMNEVTSLHNLSKFVTNVFDFRELVDSVTKMTLDVSEAKSSWLEIVRHQKNLSNQNKSPEKNISLEIVARQNISLEEIELINTEGALSMRQAVLETQQAQLIDDFKNDKRTKNLKGLKNVIGSMIAIPLMTQNQLAGVLCAVKDIEYGFDREDIEIISAFADQAAIAIQNSRLIEKSMERERLMREMILAQEMQKKLLPQNLPKYNFMEIEALSTPAFEVGGDYYDYLIIDDRYIGVVVGDVSGKGVSAAFYMAEMKGVFQSLCKIYPEPKEFLSRANAVISASIDKRWFISLVYALIDLETGTVVTARAGHCPLIFSKNNHARFIRPSGLGIGMGNPELFSKYIQEEKYQLENGDVCVFYTDGITEARGSNSEEFGYERLLNVVERNSHKSAMDIRDEIISEINEFTNDEPPDDDITLLIIKWKK